MSPFITREWDTDYLQSIGDSLYPIVAQAIGSVSEEAFTSGLNGREISAFWQRAQVMRLMGPIF